MHVIIKEHHRLLTQQQPECRQAVAVYSYDSSCFRTGLWLALALDLCLLLPCLWLSLVSILPRLGMQLVCLHHQCRQPPPGLGHQRVQAVPCLTHPQACMHHSTAPRHVMCRHRITQMNSPSPRLTQAGITPLPASCSSMSLAPMA